MQREARWPSWLLCGLAPPLQKRRSGASTSACFWLCPEACLPVQAARPDVSARLRGIPGVTVIPRDDDLKFRHAHSRIWNETWLAAFFHKPCNHELFVLQSLNMEGAPQIS